MTPPIYRRKTCRMCGSGNLELVFQLAPSPIGDAYVRADKLSIPQERYPIDLFLCRDCGLSQLLDVIAPELLYGEYIYVTSSSLGLADHFQRYAADVLARIKPAAGELVVDLGSNDGTLLRCFQNLGMKSLGVEPAGDIARAAMERGVETIPAFFTPDLARRIRCEHGPASIVTANNVYANIDDLQSFTHGVRELLAPDGVFVFESYYLADLIENMVFDFIYHEHISSFAVKPVQRFFASLGMELIDVLRVPIKGGSLRYFVQQAGGPRNVSPAVASLISREERLGLYSADTFHNFAAKIDGLKVQTRRLLDEAKARGEKIAGFGASITVTTLIYHFDLGGYFDYLVDDNPVKQGRFSPGLHLPVLPAEVLCERKPDLAVILAWRYFEPIISKQKRYLEQGGTFVVPVPELKVIRASRE
jgi:hypothetical protein